MHEGTKLFYLLRGGFWDAAGLPDMKEDAKKGSLEASSLFGQREGLKTR